MSTVKPFLHRYHLPIYFILVFAISWGCVYLLVGPDGFPGTSEEFQRLLPGVVFAMLAGPSLSGILMTALLHGKEGLRDFRSRLFKWRVKGAWYAIALFAAPALVMAVLFGLSLISPVYLPGIVTSDQPWTVLLTGLITGLAAGTFEELGWTGFAVPASRRRHGIFVTGLIVGILWGAWHFLVTWWGSTNTLGDVSLVLYLGVLLFSFLPPYRILMVWVYDRTGSLLVAMLMHASLTASVRIFDPVPISGMHLLIYNGLLGVALWVVVGVVTLVGRRERPEAKSIE